MENSEYQSKSTNIRMSVVEKEDSIMHDDTIAQATTGATGILVSSALLPGRGENFLPPSAAEASVKLGKAAAIPALMIEGTVYNSDGTRRETSWADYDDCVIVVPQSYASIQEILMATLSMILSPDELQTALGVINVLSQSNKPSALTQAAADISTINGRTGMAVGSDGTTVIPASAEALNRLYEREGGEDR